MVHVPDLSKEREHRLLELSDLKKSGLSSREICDQLNSHGKTTFSGKAWTPKLVFMNLLKWEKRQNRFSLSIRAVEEGWIKTTKKMGVRI